MDIQKNYDTDKSSFYIWNSEEERVECLVGEMPKTLDEEYQEQREKAEYYRDIEFRNQVLKEEDFTDF